MKSIKINRLTLENFKSHKQLTLNFGGENRTIYGDNAAGKTSVYDALTWLLFGKDSSGNASPDIKPLDAEGNVADHQAITSVEAELVVEGQPRTFQRTLREIWTTRRGSSEAVFGGHTSDFWVDGVPMKKNAFDEQIRHLVPEDLFRLLTSVSYFANGMKWQERRSVLFDIAGTMSDREIMEGDVRFRPLLDSLGKLSLTDYKAKLLTQKRGLTGTRDDIPARISECQKTLEDMEGVDFSQAREEEICLLEALEKARGELAALDNNTAMQELQLERREALLEKQAVEEENKAYRREQEARQPDTGSLEREIRRKDANAEHYKREIQYLEKEIRNYESNLQAARDEWAMVAAKVFTGGTCQACGQPLPSEARVKAESKFREETQLRLDSIQSRAAAYKERLSGLSDLLADQAAALDMITSEIKDLKKQMEDAKSSKIVVEDREDFAPRMFLAMEKLSKCQTKIDELRNGYLSAAGAVQSRIREMQDQLRLVQGVIAQEAVKERTQQRINQLREEAQNAAQGLEAVDQMLYLMEEFVRYKASFVEGRINGMFHLAAFRLFREQANGGLEERCDVVYDGVPYSALNNGARINVGIDIINTLSRFYGVTVPLFVDNAEAVTRLESSMAQVIRLVVSENDKEVRLV